MPFPNSRGYKWICTNFTLARARASRPEIRRRTSIADAQHLGALRGAILSTTHPARRAPPALLADCSSALFVGICSDFTIIRVAAGQLSSSVTVAGTGSRCHGPLRDDDVVIGVSFKFAPPAGLKLRACQPGARPESQWRGRPARDRLRDSELRKARNLIEIEINLPDGSWPGFRVLPAPSHGPCDRFRAGVGLGKSEPESVPVDRDGSPSH